MGCGCGEERIFWRHVVSCVDALVSALSDHVSHKLLRVTILSYQLSRQKTLIVIDGSVIHYSCRYLSLQLTGLVMDGCVDYAW